jgi:hypothetical protein
LLNVLIVADRCMPCILWSGYCQDIVALSKLLHWLSFFSVLVVLSGGAQASGNESPGLRPTCARLANAMVGVLGPEFKLGSRYYQVRA